MIVNTMLLGRQLKRSASTAIKRKGLYAALTFPSKPPPQPLSMQPGKIIPHYVLPPVTNCELDWADLAIVDLARIDTDGGLKKLTRQVRDALSSVGFFYVVNHGYTNEQTKRIFDIGNIPFQQVDKEEQTMYVSKTKENGSYQGYKPRSYWHVHNGVRDEIEQYDIHHDVTTRPHPEAVRPLLPEIADFAKHNHFNVLHPLMKLMALGLELPENTFIDRHNFDSGNSSSARFLKYHPRTQEEDIKAEHLWLKGHTDSGSLSILWSQPVSGLQIRTPEGTWRWIKHIDNALVINAGDSLEFLSGGYYKATIHRVVQPPPDQRIYNRLGAFYFGVPDDDVLLKPLIDSPIIQSVGVSERFKEENYTPMKNGDYRRARIAAYGQSEVKKGTEDATEEQIVAGVLVTHYL